MYIVKAVGRSMGDYYLSALNGLVREPEKAHAFRDKQIADWTARFKASEMSSFTFSVETLQETKQ